jgi:hypothetical protein
MQAGKQRDGLTYGQNIFKHGGHAGRRAGRQVDKLAGMQAGKQRDRLTYGQNIFKHGSHAGRRAGRQVDKLAGMQTGKQRDRLTYSRTYLNTTVMLADGQVGR